MKLQERKKGSKKKIATFPELQNVTLDWIFVKEKFENGRLKNSPPRRAEKKILQMVTNDFQWVQDFEEWKSKIGSHWEVIVGLQFQ